MKNGGHCCRSIWLSEISETIFVVCYGILFRMEYNQQIQKRRKLNDLPFFVRRQEEFIFYFVIWGREDWRTHESDDGGK
jgi:hypothetical protein